MKKYIYHLFTVKNGIILDIKSLTFLSTVLKSRDEIHNYLEKYQKNMKTKKPKIEELKSLLKNDQSKIKIKRFEFVKKSSEERLKFLKSKINKDINTIYTLKSGYSYIFGKYYLNRNNKEVLEDESGFVDLNFDKYIGNAFLNENMYICCGGYFEDKVFTVSEIIYPSIDVSKYQICNDILVFNEFDGSLDNFKSIYSSEISGYSEPIIIFFRKFNVTELIKFVDLMKKDFNKIQGNREFLKEFEIINFIKNRNGEVLIIPFIDDSPLPTHIFDLKSHILLTNPSIIQANISLGLLKDNIFKSKETGKFLGGNYYYSFFKAFLSQYAYNPYENYELEIQNLPNVYIFATNHLSLHLNVENVDVVILDSYSNNNEYLKFDKKTNSINILKLKNVK